MVQVVAGKPDPTVHTRETAAVLWFADVGANDVAIAGGKGANLGELTRRGAPVPPGFIVTVAAYTRFMERGDLRQDVRESLAGADVNDAAALAAAAERAQAVILAAPMPRELAAEIIAAYSKIGQGVVAVRSSATAEDTPDASFAGQHRTFLNVSGADGVVQAVKGCWASLFEARAIFYRAERGYDQLGAGMAVPVQRMVQSKVSGVMFTVDPINGDRSRLLIEAIYGLGEAVVSGEATPDSYVVDKRTLDVLHSLVTPQPWKLVRNPRAGPGEPLNVKVDVSADEGSHQKLSNSEVQELARFGLTLERAYGYPLDIEWAYEDGQFHIVQSRAVTTLDFEQGDDGLVVNLDLHPLLLKSGAGASPGSAFGPVVVLTDIKDLGRVKQGDVLVTEMTTPDFVPAMKRAAALVTDRGGRTAHAAIISRELGIPCVVGAETATKTLRDGQVVTVDGSTGRVYAGAVAGARRAGSGAAPAQALKTMTKIYVNLAEPDLADVIATRDVDGVGLLRAEFIVARIGEHPRQMALEGRESEFIGKLSAGVRKFAAAFDPRPVIYRTTDFKTNEYRNLRGGHTFEPVEENPMIGYRGASRYVKEPDLFAMELEAIKAVRKDHKNLQVMVPFVRTVQELRGTKALLEKSGLRRGEDGFKLWMMAEVPSNVFLLDQFIDVGIDGISIGSNDLTQLILGVDRDNATLAQEFDERNPAVLKALEVLVTTAARRGISCSICGQAPSFFPDLTAKLVEWGITSISVSPDAINKTRLIVYEIESRREKPSA